MLEILRNVSYKKGVIISTTKTFTRTFQLDGWNNVNSKQTKRYNYEQRYSITQATICNIGTQ